MKRSDDPVGNLPPWMSAGEAEILAPDGRRLGRRAQETRRRLLDATAALLESHGVLELKGVEIARHVGTSPATFYQYFRDVDEAVLALAEEAGEDIESVARWVRGEWRGTAGLATARALVDGFMRYWDPHR